MLICVKGMNQRAASIPKISMSFLSMLENNSTLANKPTDLNGYLTPELAHGDTHSTGAADRWKSVIELLLWDIAQRRLEQKKAREKPSPFFTLHTQSSEPSLQLDDDDLILPPSSDQELDSDDDDDDDEL